MTLLNWLHGSKSKLSLQYSPLDRIQALTKNIYRKSCVIRHKIIWNMLLWFLEATLHGRKTYYGLGRRRPLLTTHLKCSYLHDSSNKACTARPFIQNSKETLWTELDSIFHFMQKGSDIWRLLKIFSQIEIQNQNYMYFYSIFFPNKINNKNLIFSLDKNKCWNLLPNF